MAAFLAAWLVLLCVIPAGAAESEENVKHNEAAGLASALTDDVSIVIPETIAPGGITQTAYWRSYAERLPAAAGGEMRAAPLPRAYDLRDKGLCTTVKDQNPWGTCWAFGTLSSLESNILVEEGAFGGGMQALPDYSEHQLAWFAYEQQDEVALSTSPSGAGQIGEGERLIAAEENQLDQGGNMPQATSKLATWQGAADEASIPYQNAAGNMEMEGDWSLSPSQRLESAVRLTDADFLPVPTVYDRMNASTGVPEPGAAATYDRAATAAIKRAILEHGAVGLSYHADVSRPNEETGSSLYFNYDTWSQYVDVLTEETMPNHGVSIIGWDDGYSKTNFREGKQPPADGAWIVKNSWGTSENWPGADGSGCFYLSYYDHTIYQVTSFQGETAEACAYDNNYQYDYLGLASNVSIDVEYTGPCGAANLYTAAGDEWLRAVSTVTDVPGSKVTVNIYRVDGEAEDPCAGKPEQTFTETVTYAGYHTLELTEPLYLNEGERFAVAVCILEPDENYYVPIEMGTATEIEVQWAVCNPEESYLVDFEEGTSEDFAAEEGYAEFLTEGVKDNGIDLAVGNAMIKAFTSNAAADEVPTVTAGTGGTARVSGNGTTVTILPEEGYETGKVFVNGEEVEAPWSDVLTGLKSGDRVEVEFVKAWANPFTDVKRNTWYYQSVRYAYENELLLGTSKTRFEPASPMAREMLVTVLYRAAGEPELSGPQGYPFADVDMTRYYANAVYWARTNQIVLGVDEEHFGTGQNISRQDLCTILYRYAEYAGMDVSGEGELSGFEDTGKISGYAREAVGWAVKRGILAGKGGGVLDPQGSAKRSEVAAMLQRFLA